MALFFNGQFILHRCKPASLFIFHDRSGVLELKQAILAHGLRASARHIEAAGEMALNHGECMDLMQIVEVVLSHAA